MNKIRLRRPPFTMDKEEGRGFTLLHSQISLSFATFLET